MIRVGPRDLVVPVVPAVPVDPVDLPHPSHLVGQSGP